MNGGWHDDKYILPVELYMDDTGKLRVGKFDGL